MPNLSRSEFIKSWAHEFYPAPTILRKKGQSEAGKSFNYITERIPSIRYTAKPFLAKKTAPARIGGNQFKMVLIPGDIAAWSVESAHHLDLLNAEGVQKTMALLQAVRSVHGTIAIDIMGYSTSATQLLGNFVLDCKPHGDSFLSMITYLEADGVKSSRVFNGTISEYRRSRSLPLEAADSSPLQMPFDEQLRRNAPTLNRRIAQKATQRMLAGYRICQ